MTPIKLTEAELKEVLSLVNIEDEYGAGRICRLLAAIPNSITRDVNRECSVGNISDIVNKAINPRIHSLGLFVSCSRPPAPILNKFNQATGQHFWAFYRIPEAANDAEFSDILREGKA